MELLEKVLEDNNLELAYKRVYQNKGSKGVDGVTVFELNDYMKEHMEEIKKQIRIRKYKPSPVRKVYIPKDNGEKRGLGIPTVIDRVIQQAIVQVLTPIYEEQFSSSSYGFRPKRSCEMAANRVMESVTRFIEKKLGLKVNAIKSKVARPRDIRYLGYGFYYNKFGKIKPKPHLKSIEKFKIKLKQLTKRSWSISLEDRIKRLNYLIRGWINYFRIADMKCEIKGIGSHLNRRIRCIIWKQWKTCNNRIRCLMKLGVYENKAKMCAYSRKSYWFISKQFSIQYAISNKRLKQKGLVLPLEYYLKVHIEM